MMGPGALLAEQLLARLSDDERDTLERWGDTRDFVEGFFIGRFGFRDISNIALANAARAFAAGEVKEEA